MDQHDDDIKLSASTLAALQEFYSERDERLKQFEQLKTEAESQANAGNHLDMSIFTEDWNTSQFWYSENTAKILAEELLDGATRQTWIAVVSAPSAFVQIKNMLNARDEETRPHVRLLEYDRRFEVFPEFVFYDFNNPLKLSGEQVYESDLKGRFDRIICDPPFISEECQTKAALTARWLLRPRSSHDTQDDNSRIIVCTGERMESLIWKLYPATKTTTFEPEHAKSRLSNAFRCYANYECGKWKWR